MAAASELTLTSLADDGAVRSVVTGREGAAAGLGDGVLADASTVSPQTTAQLGEATAGRFVASPILGSPMAVLGGEATYLIGGQPSSDGAPGRRTRRFAMRAIAATWERTRRWPRHSS